MRVVDIDFECLVDVGAGYPLWLSGNGRAWYIYSGASTLENARNRVKLESHYGGWCLYPASKLLAAIIKSLKVNRFIETTVSLSDSEIWE